MMDDAALSARLIVEEWIERYYPDIYRLALAILHDPDEASDAAQDCFVAADRAINGFQYESSPKTWLYAIAINTCRTRLRKHKTQRALVDKVRSIQSLFERLPSPEDQIIHAEQDSWLREAIRRLDEKHRLPIVLYYLEDLPVREIAYILGINEGTVHSRLHYARSQLLKAAHHAHIFGRETQEAPH
ncbi:MAG TPA: RNA polymerase sigma factor [Levilinea sp.]|nr:RNA polymerase sigma factor [Levilinea sp.]